MEQQPPAVIRGSNTETELTAMNANATATEVSLPGAEPNAIEQPVILRLLNSDLCANEAIEVAISQANRINPNIKIDEQSPSSSSESYESSNPLNHNNSSNNLVNANLKNKSANDDTTLTSNETLILSSNLEENVLDIASHLIETLNDYHSPEESVGIKELTPIEAELQTGPLELETSDIVRTVIEVEPAGVIIKKPLEHIIIRSKSLQSVKSSELVDEVDKSLHQHIKHLPDITLQIADNYFDQNLSSHESFIAAASILKNEEQTLLSSEELSPEKYRNISNEEKTDLNNEENSKLSQEVNQQLLEVTNILESQSILQHTVKQNGIIPRLDSNDATTIKLITVPSPTTKLDEKERQLFIDSLPQIGATQDKSDTHILALDCKREYYQSLKKYLIESSADKPPLPLRTYRWEDLRRAKERGGYPWTHLYKRPLGPDEEPEIVLMLRKSQEIRFTSESPKSIKKVRIHEEVTIKEAERYLQELSEEEVDDENLSEQHLRAHASEDSEIHSLQSESLSCVSDSILATGKPKKSNRFNQVRRLFRRRRFGVRPNEDAQSLPDTLSELSQQLTQPHLEHVPQHNLTNKTRIGKTAIYEKVKSSRCFPIMKKLKIMADSQKKRLHIKRIPLGKDDRITFTEETKILKLKNSPKSQRSNIAHFVEKQDSDDVLEIVELDESPSRKRRDDDTSSQENNVKHLEKANNSSVIEPEEIIDIPMEITEDLQTVDPPKRAPRLRRDHVYEEIDQPIELPPIQQAQFNFILDATSVEALKQSLVSQDRSAFDELAPKSNIVPLDRMGSSEEEQLPVTEQRTSDTKSSNHLLAPISSIDSTSSEEDRNKIHLPQVIEEESDQPEDDQHELGMKQLSVVDLGDSLPKASTIKKEASPGPSEKKVTFSHVEDEAEPHREDIELSPEHMEATKEANKLKKISISFPVSVHSKVTFVMSARRSASVGALPLEKKHFVSRNESTSGISLDVRCACQFYQSNSLLPERINPVDSPQSVSPEPMVQQEIQFTSDHSLTRTTPIAGSRLTQREPDHLSMRSLDRNKSWDQTSANVDVSFLEKHPQLEETARTRGLVVRRISDVPQMQEMQRRSRFTSVDRMSNASGGGGRDLETLSMHSGISLRRISRSPSKADLFVADLNIATPTKQREQGSISASRRSSNVELFNVPPHINVIASTPLPLSLDKPPDFSRSPSKIKSPSFSSVSDYTNARRPMSPDYMRPHEQKENINSEDSIDFSNILPQNRPIIVSDHKSESNFAMGTPADTQKQAEQHSAIHPLLKTVFDLEEETKQKQLVTIEDNIKIQKNIEPVQVEVPTFPLNLSKKTNIETKTSLAQVKTDKLMQLEHDENKNNVRITDKLHVPETDRTFGDNKNDSTLKRAHSPERRNSAILSKKSTQNVPQDVNANDNVSDTVKPSYAARFMSMFTPKSASVEKEQSPSDIKREKSPAKMMSVFSKDQPSQLKVMSASTAVIRSKPDQEAASVKVVETFSLKVDEMDQYMIKPKVPTVSPSRQTLSMSRSFSSRDDLQNTERSTNNIKEPFTPVIISRNSDSTSFLASGRTLYSSESEMLNRGCESELRGLSKEPSIHSHPEAGGKPLFSATIMISNSQRPSSDRERHMYSTRSPSEQRAPLHKFAERTQSQDRRRMSDAQDYLSRAPMTKTVSFNFDDRKSRLSEFENRNLSQDQNKEEFLERSPFSRDHEYEPIGAPAKKEEALEEVAATTTQEASGHIIPQVDDIMKQTEDVQKELESNFFSNVNLTPQKEIEAFAGEETIDKPEKKGFMASAHDHTRKMQAGIKSQASKLKTKLRPSGKKSPSGSPKTKDRKRFKAPEFSKIKMPDIKRPDMSKLKEMKRPEFTKFDMSKFKLSDKITPMKLKRSKSLKENEKEIHTEEATKDSPKGESFPSQKKLFDFHFGTYPRALQRKKKKAIEVESSFDTTTATEATSIIPSTGTQPSFESSGSPQGDRGPGPVRSRWADKFSDVSYNDSEGSRYRRFESEQGSFDRESSMEQRIREDMDETPGEDPTLAILGGVTDNKQFAEFDEENRAIHEISNLRSGEFKRRPIVHQDSDLRSDDSKEAIGWTEKDIEKNSILHRAEIETDEAFLRHPPYDTITQETQSTTSSGKKLVLEEIDEDEFFLRKRGISQDNIELRQYISDAIRERYDAQPDRTEEMRSYDNYDTPPPKPRRLYKMDDDFQRNYVEGDNAALSESGIDISAPKPPLRKLRGRSNYSIESGEVLMNDEQSYQLPYFDNDEDYLRPPSNTHQQQPEVLNNLNSPAGQRDDHISSKSKPQVPKRQKRRREMSLEKDSFINGFGGRSVSNSFLQPPEDVIVYRTEHEYHHIPLATPDKYSDSLSIRKSLSNYDFDERTSRSAASMEQNLDSDKYLMELNENDGYAVVRKDHAQKPTPPARRKKISRLPGERFATMPATGSKRSTSPPERPPPPKAFTTSTNNKSITVHNIAHSRDNQPHNEDDYEEAGLSGRPDSPRYLQSGDVINKMKYRPLPPPPRPPREKRQNVGGNELEQSNDDEQLCETSSQVPTEDESVRYAEEVEASTQTDPLPDDFVCEEFEITDDMKIIKPRIYTPKTLDQVLQEELETEPNLNDEIDSEQLTKGLQRFRDANQRSLSERSRASSQADQSKALSRPQTPSATLVERQMLTPVIQDEKQTLVEASLVVQPIEDLTLEKDELRRKIGLLSVNSLSKDDLLAAPSEASYAPSSNELNEALELLASDPDAQQTDEEVERTLQRYREELNEIGRQLMETTTSQELSPAPSKDEMKEVSDREEIRSDEETYLKTLREYAESDLEPIRSDEETAFESILVSTTTLTEREPTENLKATIDMEAPPPQPPPRRKSIVTELVAEESALQPLERQDLTPVKSLIRKETDSLLDLPCRVGDLEVDHLRVHALQAGKIMVSQLHGTQISSNELECNSGNLIVKNIELPPGLIEDIVDRVRQSERSQLHTAETQTSLEGSNEKLFTSPPREVVPPPKPPRLKDLEATKMCVSDEQTQTDSILSPSTIFPSPEYLQSLAPLAFYNLHRAATTPIMDISPTEINRSQQKRRQRQRTRSVSELEIEDQVEEGKDNLVEEAHVHSPHMAQRGDSQSVSQAGRNFITACSLSLAKIITQLTDYVKGSKVNVMEPPTDIRNKQVPALVVLFIVITFAVLIFLATGRNIHIHHWDYFNPPGHEGRQSS